MLQVVLSFLLMAVSSYVMLRLAQRHFLMKSKLEKIFRMVQQLSFTIMMLFVALFYFDQDSSFLSLRAKNTIVTMFAVLIISNVGLEAALLVKSLSENFCRKKKGSKLN